MKSGCWNGLFVYMLFGRRDEEVMDWLIIR